jgi:hypothetical protein
MRSACRWSRTAGQVLARELVQRRLAEDEPLEPLKEAPA